MKYFPLDQVTTLLNNDFSIENIELVKKGVQEDELKVFLEHLKQANAALYLGWIDQWREVQEIIEEGGTALPYKDYLKLEEHLLFKAFQHFVTPFLAPSFLRQLESGELSETFEYLVLVEPDTRLVIESKVYAILQKELDKAINLSQQKKTTEEQLISVIHDAVNDQNTRVLNSFSKQSYHFVVSYIEGCFSILNQETCTFRLANWLVKQLQHLVLNPEHAEQLKKVQLQLASGSFTSKQTKRSFSGIKPWFTTIFLSAFLAIVIWMIVAKPWSAQAISSEFDLASSYTEFTLEERKYIDSLLAIQQPNDIVIDYSSEQDYMEGREILVDARVLSKNQKMENYHLNWEQYLTTDSSYSKKKCEQLSKQSKLKEPDDFLPLAEKKQGALSFLRNESVYSIHVLVYENRASGKAYFAELKSNEEIQFKFQAGEHIQLVAGKSSIPFYRLGESLVFCEFNEVTFYTLMKSYELKSNVAYQNKLLIVGSDPHSFQLMDIHQILQEVK